MNMKQKRDFYCEDHCLKKQKCQSHCDSLEVKADCESIQIYDLAYEDMETAVIVTKKPDDIDCCDMDIVGMKAGEVILDNTPKTPVLNEQSLGIIDEEEDPDAVSIGLTTIMTPEPSISLTPDLLTPTLLLLLVNICQPTLDLYRDLDMLFRLSFYPAHWGLGFYLFSGICLNFLFTCWAWWRLEPREKKSWTWVLLLLQVQQGGEA